MKPSHLAFAAAILMLAGFSGRALWQTANPPDPASAYAMLFETHCLSRLARVQSSGADPHLDLPEKAQRITRLDAAGLQAIQTRHRCEVKDATRLMTGAQRDTAVALIVSLIKEKLPELADNGDPLPWDLFRAFTSAAPAGSDAKWGVILIRNKPDSGDALQMTVTQLALPRS